MNIQTIIPIPIYTGNDHSGPWTNTDTQIGITISLVVLIIAIICVIIELFKGYELKDILTLSDWSLSSITEISLIILYFVGIIWFGILLYNLLF